MEAIQMEQIGTLTCDADGCGFRFDMPWAHREQWIDESCPRCDAILLTREGFEAGEAVLALAKTVNAAIGPVPDDTETLSVQIKTGDTNKKNEHREVPPMDYADGLRAAERLGAENDEPEGARYIQISDTLANRIADELDSLGEHHVPPARRFTHWRGECGHEWLKSQSEGCPYCALAETAA